MSTLLERQYANRLKKEFAALQKSPPPGISVSLESDNLHVWEAVLEGPPESPYKGGRFKVRITIPDGYPMEPPLIHFITSIYHLNVSQSCGQVCLGFLSTDNWQATNNVEQILRALFSLLIKPEVENSFDHDLLNEYTHFNFIYISKAEQSALSSIKG